MNEIIQVPEIAAAADPNSSSINVGRKSPSTQRRRRRVGHRTASRNISNSKV